MKKKILSILLIGIVSCSLISCGEDKVSTNVNKSTSNRFVDTGDMYNINGWKYEVYYDSITNIVYLECGGGNASGITVLYGKDKQPMTIDEYNKTK